jgi:hypothetical protein
MYQASAPVFLKQLAALDGILAKGAAFAAEQGIDEAELMGARLAADMHPLPRQVQIASDVAKGTMARLAGIEVPSWPDDESSLGELRARVAKTREYVAGFTAEQIDGSEERPVVIKFPNGEFTMTGQVHLLHFGLANFFFHVTTAYNILRNRGVELGKRDFLSGI